MTFLCGAGSGVVVINNITSLADSLGMASSSLLVRSGPFLSVMLSRRRSVVDYPRPRNTWSRDMALGVLRLQVAYYHDQPPS